MRLMALLAALAGLVLPAVARAGPDMSDEELRRLMTELGTLRTQLEIQAKSLVEMRELLTKYQRQEQVLREELVRRGVDVEQLLAPPPTTQADPMLPALVFESPESMTEYLRENFSQRVRPDMTRLQRESAERDFNSWLNTAALLPVQVSWVMRVDDVWRARSGEEVALSYHVDREPMVAKLAGLARTLDETEMLQLNLSRLKAEQKARKAAYEDRLKELTKAPASHKPLAEQVMRQAYDRMVEINVQVRAAEARLTANRTRNAPRSTTQPEVAEFRIMLRAFGARDKTIELNAFCNERDVNRLMSAPKDSLVKIRGWVSDIALAARVGTVGIRIDHAEVLAVNVENPPPPPAEPVAPGPAAAVPPADGPQRR